jgi:hypothetical protein
MAKLQKGISMSSNFSDGTIICITPTESDTTFVNNNQQIWFDVA